MHAGICLLATTQHNAPLLTVLYWQPTPVYISWECGQVWWTLGEREMKDLRTTVLNLILSSPLKRLSLGLWDCPVGTLHERILLNLEPVVSCYCPTHSPPLILHAIIVLACFCLRLQLYSFVFYRSLATCVSPCLYLTILSGTQGVGTGDGRRRFAGTFLSL